MGGVGSGRRPKPNHLKILEGRPEREINRNEPIPQDGDIAPTMALCGPARAEWERLAPDLIDKHVLQVWDCGQFTLYCYWHGLAVEAAETIAREGTEVKGSRNQPVPHPAVKLLQTATEQTRSIGARFGLTPADRAGLRVDDARGHPALGAERLLSW